MISNLIQINSLMLVACTLIAFAGGLSKELWDHRDDLTGRAQHFAASAFVCSFTGFVVSALVLNWMPGQTLLTLASAGVTGWTGPYFLDVLSGILVRMFRAKVGDVSAPDAPQVPQPPIDVTSDDPFGVRIDGK
jgi:hypothetical protein